MLYEDEPAAVVSARAALGPSDPVTPGRLYRVEVSDLVLGLVATVDIATRNAQSVSVLARRAQIVATVQAILRRRPIVAADAAALDRRAGIILREVLTPAEKAWLVATTPGFGAIVGVEVPPELSAGLAQRAPSPAREF
jgi:hypothetical protein